MEQHLPTHGPERFVQVNSPTGSTTLKVRDKIDYSPDEWKAGMDKVRADASLELRNELMANRLSFTRSGQYGEPVGGEMSALRGGFAPGKLPGVGGEAKPSGEMALDFLHRNIPTRQSINPFNSETFFATKAGTEAGNTAEDMLRGSHYLSKRLEGFGGEEAAQEALKYQLDYSKLTEFERNIMRRAIPFFSFSRRNLPPILEDLATKPAKLAATMHATTSRPDNEFVPPYLGEGTAIKLGEGPGGARYLSSLGLNTEDEFLKAIGSALHGEGSRALQTLGGGLSPLPKSVLEQIFNTQMHTGRKLTDLRPNVAGQLAEGVAEQLGEPAPGIAQKVSQLAAATPFSRAVTSAGKLVDPRKELGAKLFNFLSGADHRRRRAQAGTDRGEG